LRKLIFGSKRGELAPHRSFVSPTSPRENKQSERDADNIAASRRFDIKRCQSLGPNKVRERNTEKTGAFRCLSEHVPLFVRFESRMWFDGLANVFAHMFKFTY